MTQVPKILAGVLFVLVLAAGAMWVGYRTNAAQEGDESAAGQSKPGAAAATPGVVTLDEKARNAAAITTAVLPSSSQREQIRASASVLPLKELVDLHNEFGAAEIELEKARAASEVSRKEYERLKRLFDDGQNASAKAVEAANGAMRADQAAVRAAERSLSGIEASARQAWGPVIAKWLAGASAEFARLVRQEEVLVRITLPAANGPVPARTATIETPANRRMAAQYVSAAPEADARIQGIAYLYRAPAGQGLVPGLNLTASVAGNRTLQGVLVPEAAVVWWQGKAWAYLHTAADRFERREVSTDSPAPGGWLQVSGFTSGERVVIGGAQLLLSEELRSQIQVAGEDES